LRIITSDKEPRQIYMALDSGKPLTSFDITKALDDGNIKFFNELRKYCSYYPSKSTVTFHSCLAGIEYSKSKTIFYGKGSINKTLKQIKNEDISLLKYCLENMFMVFEKNTQNPIFSAINFRNVIRILVKNKQLITNQNHFQRFLKCLMNDKFLVKMVNLRSGETFQTVYEYMFKIVSEIQKNK